jgi:DNA-binding transcriptional regulator YiaG
MPTKKVDLAADILSGLSEAAEFFGGDNTKARIRKAKGIRFSAAPEVSASDIKKFRSRYGLNQNQLAELLMVGIDTVKKWETGENLPKRSTQRLFQILNESPEILNSLMKKEA